MAIQTNSSSDDDLDVMSEMNTTPLIDVMLVLLVMLIITIPVQLNAVNLEMPVGVPPPPQPVIKIDADLDDWGEMPGLLLPATEERSRIVRLCWRKNGLYGALAVPDADITTAEDPKKGWQADSVEFYIESDNARAKNAKKKKNRAALKFDLSPCAAAPDRPGAARVNVTYGLAKAKDIEAAWRKTPTGYNLEFRVPADFLPGAEMAPGTVMGFHYSVNDDGKPLERFADIKGKKDVWVSPITWGAIRLRE
jgi:hypothetical protein